MNGMLRFYEHMRHIDVRIFRFKKVFAHAINSFEKLHFEHVGSAKKM